MGKTEKQELFTSAKLAEKYGVPPSKIKKAIEELGITPDETKGKCNYYYASTAKKIEKAIG